MLFADDISHWVGSKSLLKSVSLSVKAGQSWAILGPNGAGKSTLLKFLSGVEHTSSGEVYWQDSNIKDTSPLELARRRAYLSQHNQADLGFTCYEVVSMGIHPWGYGDNNQQLIESALERFDLSHLKHQSYQVLSGGERQRCNLARTFLQIERNQSDSLLLLDEPLTGLDISHQVSLFKQLAALKQHGTSSILVLHDINLALRYCDHIILLNGGEAVIQGKTHDVLNADILSEVFETPLIYSATPTPHYYWG